MKSRLQFLRMDKIYKAKKKITAALLILAMAVTSISVSDSGARAELQSRPKPVNNYDVYIECGCLNFNVHDTNGNILFEIVKGEVSQQDTERAEYIHMSVDDVIKYLYDDHIIIGNTYSSIDDLYIRGCAHFTITCTCENGSYESSCFKIHTSSGASATYGVVPNMKIDVFGDEITREYPVTELRWDKVEEATEYHIQQNPHWNGAMQEGLTPFACTQETSYTLARNKGLTYWVWAIKKDKGHERSIRSFEITISDDAVSVEGPPTKLRWKKVKKAKRYAVVETWHVATDGPYGCVGGTPFAYTQKTKYTVPYKKDKAYQIWAQKKVKGKWKTIKTIDIIL